LPLILPVRIPALIRRRRPTLAGRVAAGLAVAVLLAGVWTILAAMFLPADPPALPVVAKPASERRIVYPAGRYPVLTLPDGERKQLRSLLDIAQPLAFGDYVWDEAGVPAGPVWVRVDLALQTISVFRAGHEIGTAVILYGADGKPTPGGVYPVLQRAREHRSTLYDAEMPYMLRLTHDGVAIHASSVRAAAATHGCIGVPLAFAKRLFAQVRRGDRVAIIAPGIHSS
jgi:hypothetical protein